MRILFLCLFFALVSCQGILHWGACIQDSGKCGTCAASSCDCTTGVSWGFEACLQNMCMRCYQNADGSFETQVASLGFTCPTDQTTAMTACDKMAYKPIYSYGPNCIDFGTGTSLNCIQAVRDAGIAATDSTASLTSGGTSTTPSVGAAGMPLGVIIGISVGGAVAAACIIAGVAYFIHRRRQVPLSAAQKAMQKQSRPMSPEKKTASVRVMEQAVNDLL